MCNLELETGTSLKMENKQKKKHKKVEDGISEKEETTAKDHAFFKQMLDLIPAHFYFNKDAKEKLQAKRPRASDEKGDEEVGFDKNEWKRAKFDPSAQRTVTQLTEELVTAEMEDKTAKKKHKKNKKTSRSTPEVGNPKVKDVTGGTDMDGLQERFQARMNSFKEKRKALGKEEMLEKKRLARRLKKMKRKMKQKNQTHPKGQGLSNGDPSPQKTLTPKKPVFNKEGNMVFSKFDFTGEKKKQEAQTGKNYKQLLEQVVRKKVKAEALEMKDKNAAKEFKEKSQWQTVLQKAEGVKIKDDVDLLKKSIKRKEKLQKKTKKSWDNRVEKVEQRKKDKQDKRTANIKKKKDGRINKKIKKSKKKGHIIPGF